MKYKSLTFDEISRMDDVSLARLGDEMPDFHFQWIVSFYPDLRTRLRGPIEAKQFAASGNSAFVKLGDPPILLLNPVTGTPVFNLGYGLPDDVGAQTIRGKLYFYKRVGKFEKHEELTKAANDFTERTFAYFYTERFLKSVEEITGGTLSTSTQSSQHQFEVSGAGKATIGKEGVAGGEVGGGAKYGYTSTSSEVISYYSNIADRAKLTAYLGEETLQLQKTLYTICLKHRGGEPYKSQAESDRDKFKDFILNDIKAAYESEIQGMVNTLKPILRRN